MFENSIAIRAKKENLLNSKVKTFRDNYSQSLERTSLKSSIHSLAKTVYSNKYNKEFTPKKQRPPSAGNPEHHSSQSALKGLDMRASQIPNMSDINTELLIQKRKLQERIMFLKEQIARETRCRNKADTNWRLYKNHKQAHNEIYQQHCRKSAKLNENIAQTRNECYEVKCEVDRLRKQNEEKVNGIQMEDKKVKDMHNKVNILKNTLIQEQKMRNAVKAELVKQQRVMDSFSIETKELQNERAMVLLQINQSVLKNKI